MKDLQNELLSKHTTLRVGGPAGHFYRVSSEAEIIAAIEGAGDHPILILTSMSGLFLLGLTEPNKTS